MKLLVLALFVAAATAAPLDNNGPVDLIVNGVPDGEPLELGGIVDIKLKEHSENGVSSINLLHPLTAAGIAEAALAAEAIEIPEPAVLPNPVSPEMILPEPVVLPSPVSPDVILPEPVILPSPVSPEVILPESVVLPSPALPEIVPESVLLPSPVAPDVVIVPEPVVLPDPVQPEEPVAQLGEVFNDGNVQVIVNAPEAGVVSTLQGWFNMVVNYFNGDVKMSHQIV